MNSSNQPPTEQVNKPPERLHDTAGMMLKKARENANLTHVTVGEALHLTVHYIKALENDDYSKLPGATFIKGYLRAYSRFLKLDVNAVLATYEKNNASAEELNNRTQLSSRNQKRHDQTFRWAVVTAVIVVLGVAAGWWFVGKDQAASRTAAVTQQSTPQQETNRSAVTTTAARTGGNTAGGNTAGGNTAGGNTSVAQNSNIPASAFATGSTTTTGAAAPLAQNAGAANLSTEQGLTANGGTQPLSTTTSLATIAPAATVDMTVVNSTSMSALNSATGTNNRSVDNVSTVSETTQVSGAAITDANTSPQPVIVTEASLVSTPEGNVALTITPTADGARQVTLISAGADMLQLYFKGPSWVEIDDGAKGRLYNETLNGGDAMTLHGTAPFKVLLGDAAQVELSFNSVPINLASQIRSDKTARFSLGAADVLPANGATTQGANP